MRLLLPLLLASQAALADTTGNELLSQCRTALGGSGSDMKAGMCVGYLIGFGEGFPRGAFATSPRTAAVLWCVPKGVTNEQVVRIYIKWAEKNPETLHMGAGFVLSEALQDAFPCSR